MYEHHFGFTIKPFSMTPDPAFIYRSRQHAMAMTMLEYGLESQAPFCLLTGDIGSGKTTLIRHLLRDMGDRVVVGLVSNTHVQFKSVLGWALSALGIVAAGDADVAQYEALVKFLVREYARERRTLLIFDEAQNLSMEVLEELRLLSNVNSERDLMLQVMLVGQPELRTKLLSPTLRQFAQRVSVDFHLQALDLSDTDSYIRHRLQVAGGSNSIFSAEAIECVHMQTEGVPRLINQLCDFALLYAFADGRRDVDLDLMTQVVRDRASGVAMPKIDYVAAPRTPLRVPEPQPSQSAAAVASVAPDVEVDALNAILRAGIDRVRSDQAVLWVPDKSIELAVTRAGKILATESFKRAQQNLLSLLQQQNRTFIDNRNSTSGPPSSPKILAFPIRDPSKRVTGMLALFNPPSAPDFSRSQTRVADSLVKKAAEILYALDDADTRFSVGREGRLRADPHN